MSNDKCPNCGSERVTVFEMCHCQDCDEMWPVADEDENEESQENSDGR